MRATTVEQRSSSPGRSRRRGSVPHADDATSAVLDLQRKFGNGAVVAVVQRGKTKVASKPKPKPAPKPITDVHGSVFLADGEYRITDGNLYRGSEAKGTPVGSAQATLAGSGKSARVATLPASYTDAAGKTVQADLVTLAGPRSVIRAHDVWAVRTNTGWAWPGTAVRAKKGKGEKVGRLRGFKRFGGGRVDETVRGLRDSGKLKIAGVPVDITDAQITALQGVAEVETSGQVAGINSYDSEYMSFGFKQVVFNHGSLQEVISYAPAAFARYGISLDTTRKWNDKHPFLVGLEKPNELRGPDWAVRFFQAGLDPEVIAAQVKYSKKELGEFEREVLTPRKGELADRFLEHPVAYAWLFEVRNNRPGYAPIALRYAIAGAKSAGASLTADGYLDILEKAIERAYVENEADAVEKRKRRDLKNPKYTLPASERDRLTTVTAPRKAKNITSKIGRSGGAPSKTKTAPSKTGPPKGTSPMSLLEMFTGTVPLSLRRGLAALLFGGGAAKGGASALPSGKKIPPVPSGRPRYTAAQADALVAKALKQVTMSPAEQASLGGKKQTTRQMMHTALKGGEKAWFANISPNASFLGLPIEASSGGVPGVHRILEAQLAAAEEWIQKTVKVDGKAVGTAAQLGISKISGLRMPTIATGGTKVSNHCYGLAIDIDAESNPYVRSAQYFVKRAHFFMTGQALELPRPGTEAGAAWDTLHRANQSLVDYLALAQPVAGKPIMIKGSRGKMVSSGRLERAVGNLGALAEKVKKLPDKAPAGAHLPADARLKDPAWWAERIAADYKGLVVGGNFPRNDPAAGIMDLKRDLVMALVRQGKLRWGGQGFGDGFDIMHFDIPLSKVRK